MTCKKKLFNYATLLVIGLRANAHSCMQRLAATRVVSGQKTLSSHQA